MTDQIKAAKGSLWKKMLWWCAGIIAAFGALTVLVLYFVARKKPKSTVTDVLQDISHKVDVIDIEAKARIAVAEGAEQKVIDRINSAAVITDRRSRLQALASALAENY